MKVRLSLMNFLEFAVWGSYLTCMGIYLGNIGMAGHIGAFYAMQGIVSIFMPALMTVGFRHNAFWVFVIFWQPSLCLLQDGMVWLMVKGQVLPFSLHSIH